MSDKLQFVVSVHPTLRNQDDKLKFVVSVHPTLRNQDDKLKFVVSVHPTLRNQDDKLKSVGLYSKIVLKQHYEIDTRHCQKNNRHEQARRSDSRLSLPS